MTPLVLAVVGLLCAGLPALLFRLNLRHYRPPRLARAPGRPKVSVLVPARDEERCVAAAVESALASSGVEVELIVLDDGSTDRTAELVRGIASRDPSVRLVSGPPLSEGWCGKQHACRVLSRQARHDLLLFLDADVRLEPDGLSRLVGFLEASGADLVSGVPRQETGTFLEKLVIPLIHFVLLGFLPVGRMRASGHPAYAAGCGQLFLARREPYERVDGHGAVRTSLHDGLTLPRAFRAAGLRTDLCDATDVAVCRMYRGGGELWSGLARNATEGLARPALIAPATLLLLCGQVLPPVVLAWGLAVGAWPAALVAGLGTAAAYDPRLTGAVRFRQSFLGAFLHPVGVVILLAIQWYGLGRALFGRPAVWKGRAYARPGEPAATTDVPTGS